MESFTSPSLGHKILISWTMISILYCLACHLLSGKWQHVKSLIYARLQGYKYLVPENCQGLSGGPPGSPSPVLPFTSVAVLDNDSSTSIVRGCGETAMSTSSLDYGESIFGQENEIQSEAYSSLWESGLCGSNSEEESDCRF